MTEAARSRAGWLNQMLTENGLEPLDSSRAGLFNEYLSLIMRWNARMNLTSVRGEEEILSRHFVESIACARALPAGIHTLLDFGSGAGFPGFPIALCRPEIAVMLAESQSRKAAFLQEAVRVLRLSTQIYAARAETLSQTFDCVTLRAVDRMSQASRAATRLLGPEGWLALMATSNRVKELQGAVGDGFSWVNVTKLPGGEDRLLALGRRESLNTTG